MQVKKAINTTAVSVHDDWLVIVCNVEGNRILESHFTETAADKAAIICNDHDTKYGHKNQYVVRHRDDIEVIE